MIVSVIIPAYKRGDELETAVRSVLNQDFDPAEYEVIVVDSSPDRANRELIEVLRAEARCALRCLHKEPEGPGPSRNMGAQAASGAHLAFLDSDCNASPGWLRAGVGAFAPGVGLVQGKTIPDPAIPPHILNQYIDVQEESFIYEAANIFYLREAFLQSGGFLPDAHRDRVKPLGGEDLDLGWKVKNLGWQSRFAKDALVVHPVMRMNMKEWIFPRRLSLFPWCVRTHPVIRRFFFLGYFFDEAQFWLGLGLTGLLLSPLTLWMLVLWIPYVVFRAGKASNTLPGPLRVLRIAAYFPRDLGTLVILLASSIRERTILL